MHTACTGAEEITRRTWLGEMGDISPGRPFIVGAAEMEAMFELADKGVRVVFVPCLRERWLYLTRPRLLLMDERVSKEERVTAAREVMCRLPAD